MACWSERLFWKVPALCSFLLFRMVGGLGLFPAASLRCACQQRRPMRSCIELPGGKP